MPETTISPALTAKEWVRALSGPTEPYSADVISHLQGIHEDGDVVIDVCANWDGNRGSVINRHSAAALCLYGQPFGFTLGDVDAITEGAAGVFSHHHEFCCAADECDCREWADHLERLAGRIKALLPPREDA